MTSVNTNMGSLLLWQTCQSKKEMQSEWKDYHQD